jgi:hypothetical protein
MSTTMTAVVAVSIVMGSGLASIVTRRPVRLCAAA